MKKFMILFFMLVYVKDRLLCDGVCVTWDIHDNQLEITCKMYARNSTVSVLDNFGKHIISCNLNEVENTNKHCQGSTTDGIVAVNYSSTKLMLTIKRNHVTEYDGQWTCQVDLNDTQTNVSSIIGVDDENIVQLEVKPIDKTGTVMTVEMKCFSCRDPHGLLAELVLDNRTVDSLTYHPATSTCYHTEGVCSPDICTCSSNNQFIRQLTVDLSTSKLYSCMMSFVNTYTESKISKTAGIYFDGKDFIPVKTVTTVIKPGKSGAKTTTKITLSSTERSTNKSTDDNSMKNDKALSSGTIGIIVGLSTGFVLLSLLVLVIVLHCIKIRKKNDKGNQRTCYNMYYTKEASRIPLIEDGEDVINTNQALTTVETFKRNWLLAGFFLNAIHENCYQHIKNKMRHAYIQLNNKCNINKQEHHNFLKIHKGKILHYENVNGNFMVHGENQPEYDYKICDWKTFAQLLLPRRSEICHVDDWTHFDHLLDLMCFLDADMPSRVHEAFLKGRKFWHAWFSGDESFWTEEKISALTECFKLLEKYTGEFVNKDTTLLISKGVNIFTDDSCRNLIGTWGRDLSLFVKKTGGSHIEYIHGQMFDLLKNNDVYEEFLMRNRTKEYDLNKLTSLIMDIGLKVLQTFISLKVIGKSIDFATFLESNKHDIFHAWHNKKRCCQCSGQVNKSEQPSLTREQFSLLYCFVKSKEQSNHVQNNEYCICRFCPKKDALEVIDFSIALCIILITVGIKGCCVNPIIKGTKNLRNFRNFIATATELTCERYDMVWREVESTLLEMSACVDSDFQNKIRKDIEILESQTCLDEKVCLNDMLQQCEQDIKFSKNQQYEKRFQRKLNDSKADDTNKCVRYARRVQTWEANKDKIVLTIKLFPFNESGHSKYMYEVLIEFDSPKDWNLDIMLKTVRKRATSINEKCDLHIVETTLENFYIIVKVDGSIVIDNEIFKSKLERFIWNLLQICEVDFRCEAAIGITVTCLKDKPLDKGTVAKLTLLTKMKLKSGNEPFFTSCAVWSDDEFVFVDRNNSSLIFYNFKTNQQGLNIDLQDMPYSIAIIEDNKIVISFPEIQELRIMIIEKGTIKAIESTEMPGRCYTLSRKDPETVLVQIKGDGIYCFNPKSKKVSKTVIAIPNFVPCSDTLFCSAGRVVLTCRANSSLFCYDANGEVLWIVSDVLKYPTAITSDEFGNVYVTDFVSSRLYHVTPDGKYFQIISSKDDGLLHPSALYFCDKLKRLLVVNKDNGFAFCYQIQYKNM